MFIELKATEISFFPFQSVQRMLNVLWILLKVSATKPKIYAQVSCTVQYVKKSNDAVTFQVAPRKNSYHNNSLKYNYHTTLICFLSGCTENSQCTYQFGKGICDTANQTCIGKLLCLTHKNHINKINPLIISMIPFRLCRRQPMYLSRL